MGNITLDSMVNLGLYLSTERGDSFYFLLREFEQLLMCQIIRALNYAAMS